MPLSFITISGFFHCLWSLLSETSQKEGKDKSEIWKVCWHLKEERQKTKVKTNITGPKDNFFFFFQASVCIKWSNAIHGRRYRLSSWSASFGIKWDIRQLLFKQNCRWERASLESWPGSSALLRCVMWHVNILSWPFCFVLVWHRRPDQVPMLCRAGTQLPSWK